MLAARRFVEENESRSFRSGSLEPDYSASRAVGIPGSVLVINLENHCSLFTLFASGGFSEPCRFVAHAPVAVRK